MGLQLPGLHKLHVVVGRPKGEPGPNLQKLFSEAEVAQGWEVSIQHVDAKRDPTATGSLSLSLP